MTEPTYRAVVCEELGPPGRLQLRRLPRVPLNPGTVRVALKAAGINFPDLLTIQGLYQHRPQLPFMPGAEAAGIVTEVAAGVIGIDVGQKGIAQDAALRGVAPDGKLLIAGFAGGTIPAYAANRILLKGCTVIGVRTGEAGRRHPEMRARELEALLALAAQGLVRPFVSARFP